jgi:hypothetical protein
MDTPFELDPRKLAAVVYDDRVAIDALLGAFARDLEAAGTRISGLLQLPKEDSGCGPEMPLRLRDLATDEVLPMCQALGPYSQSCRLDPARFQEAATRLQRACMSDAQLVFVSRFGKLEARGQGFRREIAVAVEHARPVLTAVKRSLVHNWFEFTGGVGTVLDAHLWVLNDWWRELGPNCP